MSQPQLIAPNLGAILLGKDELRVQELPMPTTTAIPPTFVLLRMRTVGICGSDVHYWKHGKIGNFVLNAPMCIGHECAAQIIGVGEQVHTLKVGDRVAIEPGVACYTCEMCLTGHYNLCPDMGFFATPPYHGSLCKYILHPANLCFALPDSVSYEEGAMCEPLSVAVNACNRAPELIKPGKNVAVMGAGPIGLLTLLVAKAYGASFVAVTDINEERLAMARKLGADLTVCVTNLSHEQAMESVKSKTTTKAGNENKATILYDCVIDCVGMSSTMNLAIGIAKSSGCVILVGMGEDRMTLNTSEVCIREVDIKGMFRYRNTYPTCVALLATKRIDVTPLITHRIALHDGNADGAKWTLNETKLLDGFEISRTGRNGAIKVMFEV